MATFSARVLSSVSVSVGEVTACSFTSVNVMVKSSVLVLVSDDVDVTEITQEVTVS